VEVEVEVALVVVLAEEAFWAVCGWDCKAWVGCKDDSAIAWFRFDDVDVLPTLDFLFCGCVENVVDVAAVPVGAVDIAASEDVTGGNARV